MSRNPFAGHPFLLGFDEVGRIIDRAAKNPNSGYPPYNIEQRSDADFRITIAVAGFADEDLSITVENRQLTIRGKQENSADERVFLHRGIATRQFMRNFALANGVDVMNARLENGLLHIDLHRVEEEPVIKTVQITKK